MSTTKIKKEGQETSDPYRQAFVRYERQRAALAPSELLHVRLDVAKVFVTARGALPRIEALRAELAAVPGLCDMRSFDALEGYLFALAEANAVWVSAAHEDAVEGLVTRARALRATLIADAAALVRHGALSGAQLAETKHGPNGFRNLAFELLDLSALLLSVWGDVEGKVMLRYDDLTTARTVATQLVDAVNARDHRSVAQARAADDRVRAYTLFVNAYNEARAAVGYVRRKQADVDRLVPSLFAGRGRRRGPAGPPVTTPPSTAPTAGAGAAR